MTLDQLLEILEPSQHEKAKASHAKFGNVCLLLNNDGRLLVFPWKDPK
ncbi:hypothetical protein LB521_28020 [Mesorhizobium sp. BR-1-1-8]|nr:hypothetical protein [Mesorhizobium sp. BR-1-1-8]MBZ9984986.1 hypothetical protein [Mesorhizobium sp. BR-1-1-8]